MMRKVLIGMLGFLIACGLAAAGYHFGQHLAQQDNSESAAPHH
jgi:uncharacterized protein HemX